MYILYTYIQAYIFCEGLHVKHVGLMRLSMCTLYHDYGSEAGIVVQNKLSVYDGNALDFTYWSFKNMKNESFVFLNVLCDSFVHYKDNTGLWKVC